MYAGKYALVARKVNHGARTAKKIEIYGRNSFRNNFTDASLAPKLLQTAPPCWNHLKNNCRSPTALKRPDRLKQCHCVQFTQNESLAFCIIYMQSSLTIFTAAKDCEIKSNIFSLHNAIIIA